MDMKAEQAADYRHQIRRLLFEAGRTRNGDFDFMPRATRPADTEKVGRTWRLRIGNAPLDASALVFQRRG